MSYKAKVDRNGDVAIISATGMMTLGEGSVAFRDAVKGLAKEGIVKVVLDMSHITYADSSFIPGELVSAFTSLRNRGGELVLANPSSKIKDLLQITKLYTVFRVYVDIPTALAYFRDE